MQTLTYYQFFMLTFPRNHAIKRLLIDVVLAWNFLVVPRECWNSQGSNYVNNYLLTFWVNNFAIKINTGGHVK